MKRVIFDVPHDLNRLHEELLAAVPGLAPKPCTVRGRTAQEAVFYIGEDSDGRVELTVPDDADMAAIDAVVAAHDPTPVVKAKAPTQDERLAAIEARLVAVETAITAKS